MAFGVKNGPCETLPTFDDLYLVLGIPDMSHCSWAMPFALHAIWLDSMSIPAKTLYALQQAILKDSDLGPIAIAQARAQSPGLAKRAVLNKQQSTWFFNLLKTDFAAGLPEDDLLYYRHWSSGAPLELRSFF